MDDYEIPIIISYDLSNSMDLCQLTFVIDRLSTLDTAYQVREQLRSMGII